MLESWTSRATITEPGLETGMERMGNPAETPNAAASFLRTSYSPLTGAHAYCVHDTEPVARNGRRAPEVANGGGAQLYMHDPREFGRRPDVRLALGAGRRAGARSPAVCLPHE